MFIEKYRKKIAHQKEIHLYRNPQSIDYRDGKYIYKNGKKYLNFASNDYLGLSTSQELKEKVSQNFLKYGTSSSSSRLVAGNYTIISEAEKEYATYFGYEDALFFPSGFQANVGLISTLFEEGDHIFFDKHVHASTVKGIQLSGAQLSGFKHNQMSHLEKRLNSFQGEQAAVVTESLFSMDGDCLDVEELAQLKQKYKFLTVVDEAHSIGVLGEKGKGISNVVADIAIGTFGKALGLFGSIVFLPTAVKEYLFNFSAPLIYTTTLPEAHAASTIDLLKIIERYDQQRENLQSMSSYLKENLLKAGVHVYGDAHIISIEIGDENDAVKVAEQLFKRGYFTFPARYPTVPLGKSIIRVSLTAAHSFDDIYSFIDDLQEVQNELTR